MARTLKAPALVLKIRPMQQHHRSLTMLVRGEGLLYPLAYGAESRRSLLRSTALPYHRGIAHLHYDASKEHWRLITFDLDEIHEGFREKLERFYAVTLWVEILLKSHGGGENSIRLFDLASSAFLLLSRAEEEDIETLSIAFLWYFLEINGIQPSLDFCGLCGQRLPLEGENNTYFTGQGILVGPECWDGRAGLFPDSARRSLGKLGPCSLGEFFFLDGEPKDIRLITKWVLVQIQAFLEHPLKSLRFFLRAP